MKSHITELAEQRLFSEKLSGEIKAQLRMLAEQRTLFQEQTEHTRTLMNDYKSLKDSLVHRLAAKRAGVSRKAGNAYLIRVRVDKLICLNLHHDFLSRSLSSKGWA